MKATESHTSPGFSGYYLTADAGYKDEDGYLWVMTRTDDIINVAGHRLSTGALEEVLASHPDVAECAVLGVADEIKGEIPLGLIVLKAGVQRSYGEIVTRVGSDGARKDRPGGFFQGRDRRQAAAQDALGQDSARHHQEDCRRCRIPSSADHRRSGDPR